MARTYRHETTLQGLDRCPPRDWRRTQLHKPRRAAEREMARIARLTGSDDALPAFGDVRRPYYT